MIPLRMTAVKQSPSWPSYIILHHTAEFVEDVPAFKFDTAKFQTGKYMNYSFRKLGKPETMYHFIIEKIEQDYHVIMSQPILTLCDYPDLSPEHKRSIHIGLMGDYNKDLPPIRLYRVLGYRLLAPLMRLFYLEESDILLHSAISNDDNCTCPGEFVDMAKLYNQLRSVRRKTAVRRG